MAQIFDSPRKPSSASVTLVSSGGEDLEESKEYMAFMAYGLSTTSEHHIYFVEDDSRLTDRVQTRFVLNVWGWTITHCLSPKELLGAVMDAIEDHLKTYGKGVLHRDASPANILIRPRSPDLNTDVLDLVTPIRGVLSDLDHTKSTPDFKTVPVTPIYHEFSIFIQSRNPELLGDPITEAMKFRPDDPAIYCREAKRLNAMGAAPRGEWTAKDFGWENVGGEIPDFASHVPNVVERTGTMPFISHKLLHSRVAQDAIHDLESFWWILVHIYLTRQSGGAEQQRTDLNTKRDKLITSLFYAETNTVYVAKEPHFGSSGKEEFKELSKHFHMYFKDFKPMLEKWRSVLYLGYKFMAYEYYLIHRYVLDIVRQTYNTLPDGDYGAPEAYQREIQRRIKEYLALCLPLSNPNSSPVSNPQVP